MEEIQLFSIPLYKFKYPDHDNFKTAVMPYLEDEKSWKDSFTPRSHIHFTNSNLHKMSMFAPIQNFIQTNLELVMENLGFEPKIQMTGMWGTRHLADQYHHRHNHGNSFLAGIYYLNGNGKNSGTTFYNVHRSFTQIIPAVKTFRKMRHEWNHPFEEGTLLIFPSWLEHSTSPNNLKITNSVRHILSFNSMPLGPTNTDAFDRFDYRDVSNSEMISNFSQQIGGR
jgi:uncharacterized protein (TIGR02466 family)